MSSDILYLVETLNVNDRIESDHMPVELYCKCQVNSNTTNVEEKAVKRDKYIWHVDRIDQFQENILSQVYRKGWLKHRISQNIVLRSHLRFSQKHYCKQLVV